MDKESFIFRDPIGSRWRRFARIATVAGVFFAIGLTAFVHSLLTLPRLTATPAAQLDSRLAAETGAPAPEFMPKLPASWLREAVAQPVRHTPHPVGSAGERPIRLGFLDEDVERAGLSFRQNARQLTHISPVGYRLVGMPPRLEPVAYDDVRETAQANNVALMPTLVNMEGGRFDPEAVEHYLHAAPEEQDAFAAELAGQLKEAGAKGVVIAWEQIDPTYRPELTAFIARVHEVLHTAGLELWLCVPVGDDIKVFDLDALAPHVDRLVAMLYYETGEVDPPGPVASLGWFREWLDVLMSHASPEQWVISIGTFGYDWPAKGKPVQIAFYDAMARADSAHAESIVNPAPYDGPRFSYREEGVRHTLWFLDAITFRNHLKLALAKQPGGIAVDRLGTEDPQVWQALHCGNECSAGAFQHVPATDTIAALGDGDFLRVEGEQRAGERAVLADREGFWGTRYTAMPRTLVAERHGAHTADRVTLTFDDGPDPNWTPQVLDLLKQHGVKATFFVTGQNAIRYPELIQRIVEEGHEVGNHTFSHSNLALQSEGRVQLELNATQRAIESITGRSTVLFRPPYDADRMPHTLDEIRPLLIAQQLGYVIAMSSIDPLDWQRPGTEEIIERVKSARPEGGKVVLLHDAGGDRSQTLEALGPIIDYFRKRGDEIVPMHAQLGLTPEAVMPPIPAGDPTAERVVAGTGLSLIDELGQWAWSAFMVATGLVLLRALFVVGLAFYRKHRERGGLDRGPDFTPPVSVLLAAYNEGKVIGQTIESLLGSRYAGAMELIVVNDGSTDDTAAVVEGWAARDPRVRLVTQPNGGKAKALRLGLAQVEHPFVVMLDADTQFEPDTILELMRPMSDEKVGAVCGHIHVGNDATWVGRFQALEYIAAFNLDRRAYDLVNAITVAPGAASAFRVEAIRAAGGIQTDTLAEDTDLTLALHEAGYRVRHTTAARAVTEAPRTLRSLLRQRKRWSFGTLQCLWKHRRLTFSSRNGWIGWFALPSVWFFHILLVALVPLVDFTLIAGILHGADPRLIAYTIAFMGVDLLLAMTACHLEGEPLKSAWRVVPMRLVYRPLLAIAVLYSLYRAIKGTWVGWGAQERWGLVRRWRPGT